MQTRSRGGVCFKQEGLCMTQGLFVNNLTETNNLLIIYQISSGVSDK